MDELTQKLLIGAISNNSVLRRIVSVADLDRTFLSAAHSSLSAHSGGSSVIAYVMAVGVSFAYVRSFGCVFDMAPIVVLAVVLVSVIAGGGGADDFSLVGLG